MKRRSKKFRRYNQTVHIYREISERETPGKQKKWPLLALRAVELSAAIAALAVISAWWFVERPAIKEARSVNAQQLQVLLHAQSDRAKQLLYGESNEYEKRESLKYLISSGPVHFLDFTKINNIQSLMLGLEWSESELHDFNLNNLDLHWHNFKKVKFFTGSARNTDFYRANLSDTEFIASDLSGSSMYDANISGADFSLTLADHKKLLQGAWYWEDRPFITDDLRGLSLAHSVDSSLRRDWESKPKGERHYPPDACINTDDKRYKVCSTIHTKVNPENLLRLPSYLNDFGK